ncbi:MAG: SgcJ/EcaC family oxidoreductase [Burkholderiales bacterium]
MTTVTPEDEEAIRAAVRHWERAWCAGDMQAAMALFADDADFVNVWGSHWHGRQQIESEHAQRHQAQLKNSVFSARNVQAQLIDAGLALVHVAWTIRGDHDRDGTPRKPRHGLFSWVMRKDAGGRWWIRAAHNTHVAMAP